MTKRLWMVVLVVVTGCAEERSDVRPTIQAIDVRVTGTRLEGSVTGHYENLGEEAQSVERPELQLMTPDRLVGAVELVFPMGFDATFAEGDSRDATFAVGDDGWSSFCGPSITVNLSHDTITSNHRTIGSIGPEMVIDIPCVSP